LSFGPERLQLRMFAFVYQGKMMIKKSTTNWNAAVKVMLIPIFSTLLSVNCVAQGNLTTVKPNSTQAGVQVKTASIVYGDAQPDGSNRPGAYNQSVSAGASATIPHGANISMLKELNMKMPPSDYLSEMKEDGYYCWPVEKLPIKVYFQAGKKVSGYKSKFRQCLASCFDEWSKASGGKIAWIEVSDPAQANISVRWTNTVTERAEGTEAGRTKTFATLDTRTNRGTIKAAEMLLLTRLPDREFSADEVRRAYLHEVGHAFGIAGHSHNPADIMYYAVTQHASPHLDDRDKATLVHLYNG
jgi:Matrixin